MKRNEPSFRTSQEPPNLKKMRTAEPPDLTTEIQEWTKVEKRKQKKSKKLKAKSDVCVCTLVLITLVIPG